jgi:hypothetical protein
MFDVPLILLLPYSLVIKQNGDYLAGFYGEILAVIIVHKLRLVWIFWCKVGVDLHHN